jgi:hypothetical protein
MLFAPRLLGVVEIVSFPDKMLNGRGGGIAAFWTPRGTSGLAAQVF